MFYLRIVHEDGTTSNDLLGESYQKILFTKENKQYLSDKYFLDKSVSAGIIIGECNKIPILYNQEAFIMTDSGKTFERIKVIENKENMAVQMLLTGSMIYEDENNPEHNFIRLEAEYDDESNEINDKFSEFTPSASLEAVISHKTPAADFFEKNKKYLVTIEEL